MTNVLKTAENCSKTKYHMNIEQHSNMLYYFKLISCLDSFFQTQEVINKSLWLLFFIIKRMFAGKISNKLFVMIFT